MKKALRGAAERAEARIDDKKKARTATVAHDAPPARIRIIRQTAHATAVASTTSVIAAGHQCVGASTVVSPATKNAPMR